MQNWRLGRNGVAAASRRDFIHVGSLALLGMNLPGYLRAAATHGGEAGKAQACILLWLDGGPSHVDTWDPKPNSSFRAISTNVPGIQVSELLPQIAKRMDKLAIVRSMHSKGNDHPPAVHYSVTGHDVNAAMRFPSIGSIIAKETEQRNGMPPYVVVPQWDIRRHIQENFRAGFLGANYDPMFVPDPSKKGFEVPDLSLPESVSEMTVHNRSSFLEVVDRRYRNMYHAAEQSDMDGFTARAYKMLLNPKIRDAFDLGKESDKLRDRYGRNTVGQGCLLARRLVEAGTRFVTVAGFLHNDSWDTHSKNDEGHRDRLCPTLDQSLAVLLDDLSERGLLQSTVVIAMGEFGRTPYLNPNAGRDHWPACWSMALGGGGIKGGQVVGASDETGSNVTGKVTSIGDLFATVYKAFGIDWTKEYQTPVGRPIKIANSLGDLTGEPAKELL